MHQSYNRKLDDRQTTNMIRSAATDAPTRKHKIEEAVKQIYFIKLHLRCYVMYIIY